MAGPGRSTVKADGASKSGQQNSLARVSIAVVDDHPVVRHGLATILGNEPLFKVVAEGISAADALEIAKTLHPDVAIIDLGIPGGGIEAIKEIVIQAPSVRCIVLTVCDSADVAIDALNAGAKGYILKGVSANDLKAAIRAVFNGETFVSPEFATKLLRAAQRKRQPLSEDESKLTDRETLILREVENGLTNEQIASKLSLKVKSIKYYMTSIMRKYGVSNRVAAVVAHQKLRQTNIEPPL
jgi:two-component system nitrate/nitrite response regulator NarL